MFTQNCFVRRYNFELIKKLEKMGYKNPKGDLTFENFDWYPSITYVKNGVIYPALHENAVDVESYDCKDNIYLFLALAVLQNNKDEWQWFKCPKKTFCNAFFLDDTMFVDEDYYIARCIDLHNTCEDCKKLNAEEIKELFSKLV